MHQLPRGSFVVDHASHDTTSVLATIEQRFGVAALTKRDAAVQDLSTVFAAGPSRAAAGSVTPEGPSGRIESGRVVAVGCG